MLFQTKIEIREEQILKKKGGLIPRATFTVVGGGGDLLIRLGRSF